jgi:predicted MPP superfamily phosphohydrolase
MRWGTSPGVAPAVHQANHQSGPWLPIASGVAALGAAAAAGLVGYATFVEPRRLALARRRIAVPGLPKSFAGLRLLHLSDIHIGAPHCGAAHVRAAAAALPADLIAITGDLVHGTPTISACLDVVRELHAPLGVWVVLGNHDYSYPRRRVDTTALLEGLRAAGVRVLVNCAVPIESPARTGCGGARTVRQANLPAEALWLVGVDDPHRGRHDLGAALADVPPGACALLLAHSPDALLEVPRGRVALALTGHAHGGQVRLPGLPALVTRTRVRLREPHGVRRIGGTLVHMHAGLGAPTPFRFGMPPEAALLELVPAPPASATKRPDRAAVRENRLGRRHA